MRRGFTSIGEVAVYLGVHVLAIIVSAVVMPRIIGAMMSSGISPGSRTLLFTAVSLSYSVVSMVAVMFAFFALRQLVDGTGSDSEGSASNPPR